jgi:cytoskeletal protein CcmA (bactofilin family)
MWDKKDNKPVRSPEVKPVETKSVDHPVSSASPFTAPEPVATVARTEGPLDLPKANRNEIVKIGRSIFIKGEISGEQDLIIEGSVEGKIELRDNQLTIGENGRISGEIYARHVVIHGQVTGNTFAEEKLEIKSSGTLKGDIIAPRLVLEDGAHFRGSVEMQIKEAKREERKEKKDKPVEAYAELATEK